nr:hypothetical protein [Nitrosomonas nitrosa]
MPRIERRDVGIAPKAHPAVRLVDSHRAYKAACDSGPGTHQCIFRASAIGRRAEARVAPGAGPGWGIFRIDDGIGMRFLVANERAIRDTCTINTALPSCLPVDSIPGKESQVDPGCARCLHLCPLISRPVFVVAT